VPKLKTAKRAAGAAICAAAFLALVASAQAQTAGGGAADNGPLIQALKQQLMAGIQAELDVRTQLATLQGEVGNLQSTIQKLEAQAVEKAKAPAAPAAPPK
jgi:hypothetical protein